MSLKVQHLFLVAAIWFAGSAAYGQLVVYEGFDYVAGSDLASQNGGIGWGGAWTTNQITDGATVHSVQVPLTFDGLEVTGGATARATRSGQSTASRVLSPASVAALTADDSTIWFSVLMTAVVGDGQPGNTYGTIAFGEEAFSATGTGFQRGRDLRIGNNGFAFGVGYVGAGTFASARVEGTAFSSGFPIREFPDYDYESVGTSTVLLVGKIDWAANGSLDAMTVYLVDDVANPLNVVLTTVFMDRDQTQFDTISIADGQTSAFDEIRFGATLADVLPTDGSDPGGFALGDVNRDDAVNFLDISPFISLLSDGRFEVEGDIDQNGVVNFLDISPFIVLLSGN